MPKPKSILEVVVNAANAQTAFTATYSNINYLFPLSSYVLRNELSRVDDQTSWSIIQHHFYLCLVSKKDSEAALMLQRMTERFGEDCERVVVAKSQFLEATEGLKEAEEFLASRNENEILVQKRLASFAKSRGDDKLYVSKLLKLVDIVPTDAETWAELGNTYFKIQEYSEAIHCFQEVLLATPQAYNMFARLAEAYHAYALQQIALAKGNPNFTKQQSIVSCYQQALKNFLRSIELCPVYVRAWAGVQVVTTEALKFINAPSSEKGHGNSKSPLVTEKELKYFTKFAEISERKLLYITTEENSEVPAAQIENAKKILQNY